MAEKIKCELCDELIGQDDYGKLHGTVIKIKKDDKNIMKYICSNCQREKGREGTKLVKKKYE